MNANQNMDKYWIKVRGLAACIRNKVYETAILKYEDNVDNVNTLWEPTFDNITRKGVVSLKLILFNHSI